MVGAGRLFPWVVAGVVLIFLVVVCVTGREAAGGFLTDPSFRDHSAVILPPVTIGDLKAVARGDAGEARERARELARRVMAKETDWLMRPPGPEVMFVRGADREGVRVETVSYGWPSRMVWFSKSGRYRDAIEGKGAIQSPMRAQNLAGMYQPSVQFYSGILSIDRSRGAETMDVNISVVSLAVWAVMLVGAWYAACGLVWCVKRLRGAGESARVSRWAPWAAVVLVAAGLGVLTAARPVSQVDVQPTVASAPVFQRGSLSGVETDTQEIRRTTLDIERLEKLAESPSGDVQVARELLEVFKAARDEEMLAVQFETETVRTEERTEVAWPLDVGGWEIVRRWGIKPEDRNGTLGMRGAAAAAGLPPAVWGPGRTRLRLKNGVVEVLLGRSKASTELRSVRVDTESLATCVLIVWLCWIGTRWVCGVVEWLRARSWAMTGRCVKCGYPLE